MRRALLLTAVIAGLASLGASPVSSPSPAPAATGRSPFLPPGLEPGWYATIETNLGVMLARLFPEQAPQAVAYFAAFAEGRMEWPDTISGEPQKRPYYDGVTVHKVTPMERFELGDPTGTGRGSPLIYVPLETGPKTFDHPYRLGMTRSGLGRVSASLFFVTMVSVPYFAVQHPCFGEIVAGQTIVDRICAVPVNSAGKPERPIVVDRIRIHKVGDPAPLQEPVPYTPKPTELGFR